MPSESRQETTSNQTQNSVTQPWAPTRDSLMSLLGRTNALGSQGMSSGLTGALDNLQSAASGIPNMGGDALNAIRNLFGSSTTGQVGMLNSGFNDLSRNIGATARGEELDPYKTPGFSDALATMTGDITDRVKGVYAGSGRDPSGAGSFAGSLGRGLTEGIAPILQSQFNTNNTNRFNAANQLFNAAGTTANNITQQNQVPLENALKGIAASGQLPGLYTGAANAQLGAASAADQAPWQNISRWLQGVLPIAALGSESQGTSQGTQTRVQPDSTLGNVMGGLSGLTGILGQTGAFAGAQGAGWLSSLLPMLAMSDERLKENIAEIGETHDGQPLYSYNYKGDSMPRVGLMAQDVEKRQPDAVVEIAGYKAVDYGKALSGARRVGMMHKMLEAA